MSCTTILVGKNASYDGSTLMARDDDSAAGNFTPKKFVAVLPSEQPSVYRSKISGVEIPLPSNPLRYTSVPNVLPERGIWGEAGINACNVAMSETETITSNPRVQGADPLVSGGIGEEDFLTIVLPYIHTAREGVLRLGSLLEQYGTYEMNGIGFQDTDEIWWLESIGGHHWIARRVPDDCYVVVPNQFGIDSFDFVDAFGAQKDNLCSADLLDFIQNHFLDLSSSSLPLSQRTDFDTRAAFGSHSDFDHSYNTPRAWFMQRYLNPRTYRWEGENADFTPESDDISWSLVPEKKITVEDIKYILSSYYQGTPFNPYAKYGDLSQRGKFRPIGINRNSFVAITQLRPYLPPEIRAVEWLAFGSNAFNGAVPFYANVNATPTYLSNTTATPSTENFYWANRMIAVMADAHYSACIAYIERYQAKTLSVGHSMLQGFDATYCIAPVSDISTYLEDCNRQIADWTRETTDALLQQVLYTASCGMKNSFARSDA